MHYIDFSSKIKKSIFTLQKVVCFQNCFFSPQNMDVKKNKKKYKKLLVSSSLVDGRTTVTAG